MIEERRAELDIFKTRIDLPSYLESRAHYRDPRLSSRHYDVLRHANGDKLIVTRKANGHWIYSNAHDQRDRGTIIDFITFRDGISLGEIRKLLRPLVGIQQPISSTSVTLKTPQPPTGGARQQVLEVWNQAMSLSGHHAYLHRRGLRAVTYMDHLFSGRIRTDHRGNALFAHFDSDGLCGFEIKNRNFTGFATGGTKGLFCSRPGAEDTELVVFETAIDLLSYGAMFGLKQRRLVSTAGQISPAQEKLLVQAAQNMPAGSRVVLATDNDACGVRLAERVKELLTSAGLADHAIITRLPPKPGQDWNDALRSVQQLSLPRPAFG